MNPTCSVTSCDAPRYQNKTMCGSHFMKWYRYGDPFYVAPRRYQRLQGMRFGSLVVRARSTGRYWFCDCDCGGTTRALSGDLNRGTKTSCGAAVHRRSDMVGYGTAHDRVRFDRGSAASHLCIDCGRQAAQWSYDHCDPRELIGHGGGAEGLPYSSDPSHYDPRCVPCHKTFDLGRPGGVRRVG